MHSIFSIGLDGAWGEWDEWTSCSQTCTNKVPGDIAKRTRNRSCSNPAPLFGGDDCKGYFDDAELCNQDIPCRKYQCDILALSYSIIFNCLDFIFE